MSTVTTRAALLASIAALALALPAQAQTMPATPATDVPAATQAQGSAIAGQDATAEAAAPAEGDPQDDVVVTGSRIARPDFAAPNPIVSFNAANIQQSGNTNVTAFLQRVPALVGSRDSTRSGGGDAVSTGQYGQAGLNQLNLRNLGTNRTLVLVDGRRHVAAEANTAAVDINAIPTDLIARADVLTGAVSAVYGADGVTGVVNFILKRDFEGLSARAQMGVSQYGDGANRFASVLAGKNFGEGRGNVTLAYEYSAEERLPYENRKFFRQGNRAYLIPNDADSPDNPNVPDNILVGNLHYTDLSPLGAVFVGGEANPSYDGLGRLYDRGMPAAYYFTGGVSTDVPGFYQGDLSPDIDRHAVDLLAHYDFSDAFKLSIDAKYAQAATETFGQYPETYYLPISLQNPFIPTTIRQAAATAGAENLFFNRANIDFGRLGEHDERRTYRGVVDVAGRISDHATYDAYYQYGRTSVRITRLGDRLNQQYLNALDAVTNLANNAIVCRSTLTNPGNGCIPLNPFGAGPATAEQLAYFQVDDTSNSLIEQHVASASVSGDFGQFFTLPGGPVQFSFGGEYRRESSRFDPSQRLVDAVFFPGDEPALVAPSRGAFDVREAFGELNVPILKDQPFASLLSVGAAGRYSDYSTVGEARTWQFNGVYAPVRDITFRGSYGQAVRAPNIGELFQPTSSSSNFFTDPCTPREINNGTQYRAANCQASLAAVGAVIAESLQTGDFVDGVASGNRNLRPEVARTWTAGLVLRPRFLSGLTASFDWYNIRLNGAINTVTPSDLANLCVDQQTLDNPFCASFTRAQGTGRISGYTVGPQNVANFRTAGLDFNIDYLIRTASVGTFDLRLVGGYLDKLEFTGIPGAPVTNRLDQFGSPRWNATFSPSWTLGPVSVNYNLRWFNATRAYDRNTTAANPDVAAGRYQRFDALWQHDLQVAYQAESGFGFYGGVTNLTDQKPDPAAFGTNVPISPLGRFFYFGVKARLDGK